jgi:hypothetical protein
VTNNIHKGSARVKDDMGESPEPKFPKGSKINSNSTPECNIQLQIDFLFRPTKQVEYSFK